VLPSSGGMCTGRADEERRAVSGRLTATQRSSLARVLISADGRSANSAGERARRTIPPDARSQKVGIALAPVSFIAEQSRDLGPAFLAFAR